MSGSGVVQGYASDPDFAKWQLDVLPFGDSDAAIFLALGEKPGEFTATVDTTRFPNGEHALRLRVVRQDSNYDEYVTEFIIANPTIPSKAAAPAPASTEANKALVRQYVEQVLRVHRPEVIDQFVSPSYKRYVTASATPLTPAEQKQRLAGLFAAFPDMQFTIDDMVAEGDLVAYRLTSRGTHQAPFQGIAPTGKPVVVSAIEIVRIENGKYVEHWGGPDLLDMAQQLGGVVAVK